MFNINNIFDQVYVINLDKRKDRLEHIKKQFSEYDISFRRVSAVDGHQCKNKPENASINDGEWGCTLSHIKVLKNARKNGYEQFLVFEDDVVFEDNFLERFENYYKQLPSKWEMFYLGANTTHDQKIKEISRNVKRTFHSLTTHSYALKSKICGKILNTIENNKNKKPVDNIYTSIQKEHNVYVFKPNIVIQMEGYSNVRSGFRNYDDVLKDL